MTQAVQLVIKVSGTLIAMLDAFPRFLVWLLLLSVSAIHVQALSQVYEEVQYVAEQGMPRIIRQKKAGLIYCVQGLCCATATVQILACAQHC